MSSNIFGYQGVNTPLESLTNGRYNVADYTTLREEVNARLYSLEKKAADTQDLDVSGYISVSASSTHSGYITAAGNGSFGGTLYSTNNLGTAAGLSVAGNAVIGLNLQCNGDELISGDLTVGGEENLTGDLTVGGITNVSASGIHFSDGTIQTTASSSAPSLFVTYLQYVNNITVNFTPSASSNKVTEILFNSNSSCTLNLVNLTSADQNAFPDGVRYITVYKQNMVNGDYTVTINCPVGALTYVFYTPTAQTSVYTLGLGQYSVTFAVMSKFFNGNLTDGRTVIKSVV